MSRPVSPLRALVTVVVACSVPAATVMSARPALAQPKVDKRKMAKDYTAAGLTAQNAGDYETALSFYAKAYEAVPHPLLIFNMAQAYRLAGQLGPAIEHYKKYLEADPKGAKATTAREFLTALETQRAVEDARIARDAQEAKDAEAVRQADEARKVEEARAAEETRKDEEARLAEEARVAGAAHHDDDRKLDEGGGSSPGRGMRIAGLTTAGAGVAAVGVGLFYFGRKATRLSDELSDPARPFDPQEVEDGEAANRNMIIACAAGGVLVVGGAVLYVLGRKKASSSERVTIAPALAHDRVGLVFTGSWR